MPDESLDNLVNEILKPESSQALTTQMVVRSASLFNITVADLRKLCAKFPDNPKAVVFIAATKSHRPEDEVLVERLDLEALIKNVDTVFVNTKQNLETSPGTFEAAVVQTKQLTEASTTEEPK